MCKCLNVIELDLFLLDMHCICISLDQVLEIHTSKALEPFVERSYVAIWYWIQEFNPKHLYPNKKKSRITAFIIDETQIQIGSTEAWL